MVWAFCCNVNCPWLLLKTIFLVINSRWIVQLLAVLFSRLLTQNPESVNEAAAQEANVRLEKCREDLRRVETHQLQQDARLQLLREAGVDVDNWIESARAQVGFIFNEYLYLLLCCVI